MGHFLCCELPGIAAITISRGEICVVMEKVSDYS